MRVSIIADYTHWLHTKYPAGKPEPLPEVREDGSTAVQGLYIVGDLKGIPLLKFSTDSGAKAVNTINEAAWFKRSKQGDDSLTDIVIIGAGVAGVSAALRARKLGLSVRVLEASECFSTIVNFPKAKPIYTYPKEFEPDSELQTTGAVKESLLDELYGQVREANIKVEEGISVDRVKRTGGHLECVLKSGDPVKSHAVIVAIGRSGNYRKLNVPGEDLNKVSNRLHDPKDYCEKNVLVVGGGDSALETAIAIAQCGGAVTLSYRKPEFSRPKPDNIEKIHALANGDGGRGKIRLMMNSSPTEITESAVKIKNNKTNEVQELPNDFVFAMIGREAPLDFFRKSGVPIANEWNGLRVASFVAFLLFCTFIYLWKGGSNPVDAYFAQHGLFPYNLNEIYQALTGTVGEWVNNPAHLFGTLAISLKSQSFYYTFVYSACVVIFGIDRILRRKTPYITLQTSVLMAIQVFPLFILPEIVFPWMGHNGWFQDGILNTIANGLFPEAGYGHGREYWRAYGLILAWPLFISNFFTAEPLWWWLAIGSVQTFVLIPLMIYFWGKGAYCGWVCSCGALAETMGDRHRHKMPHGLFWNKMNMIGQVFLFAALIGLGMRIFSWAAPDSSVGEWFNYWFFGQQPDQELVLVNPTYPEQDQITWEAVPGADYEDAAEVRDEQGNVIPSERWAYDFDYNVVVGEPRWDLEINWDAEPPQALSSEGEVMDDAVVAYADPIDSTFRNPGTNYISYKWVVDVLFAGIIGVGFYFWYSGRVWCRFACPLAALMHLYTKFSRFRIIADKKKCISCNVCTSVCHQGIDIMNFANKGKHMDDVECVRCSACVQSCPTGVLQFGQVDREGNVIAVDKLQASPVLMREKE